MSDVTTLDLFLWIIVPYFALAVFIGGHIWRYRYDKFGWTTRSSQIYESKLLRIGSPLFHYGIVGVFFGHVIGLGVPKSWTEAVGISEHWYHFFAVFVGTAAALAALGGLLILIYRRRTNQRVLGETTKLDKLMFVVLLWVMLWGMYSTIFESGIGGYDYRETISIWFREFWTFHPDPTLMHDVPIGFKIHVFSAIFLFMLWPFTRLVHVFSVPIGYLTRPYVVYRSKDSERQPRQRGWDKIDF